MQQFKLFIIAFLTAFIVACGGDGPTFDASSEQAMEESVAAMKAELSEEEQQKLDAAIAAVSLQAFPELMAAAFSGNPEEAMLEIMDDKLGGKTAEEIIDMAGM